MSTSSTRRTLERQPDAAGRLVSPSSERNRDPILAVLGDELTDPGAVLEVASGTGQHAVHMAAHLPHIIWQPSDPDPQARASVAAWREQAGLANLRQPMALATTDAGWEVTAREAMGAAPVAVYCCNMIHIAPWAAAEGLVRGAGRLLPPRGLLFLYGPFMRDGTMVESNVAFDARLRAQDADWGIRALEDVTALAADSGFVRDRVVEMPANNLSVCFRRNAD